MLEAAVRVEVVQNGIGVALISSGENDDIGIATEILDDLPGMWANAHIPTDRLALKRFKGHFELIALHQDLARVDERFVHIEHDGFAVYFRTRCTLVFRRHARVWHPVLAELDSPHELLESHDRCVDVH